MAAPGRASLNDAFGRQVLPDGVHCERNPDYHKWMTGGVRGLLAPVAGDAGTGLELSAAKSGRMHDYELASRCAQRRVSMRCTTATARTPAGARADWDAARRRFLQDAGLPDRPAADVAEFP